MNVAILTPEVQDFINGHLKTDATTLILKGVPFNEVTVQEVVEQIEAKSKSEKKLPTWFQQPNIYFPNKLNIEQTSSEVTAHYKSKLINGKTLIDLTGGFGVDAFYFAKHFKKVTHCEWNSDLSTIVRHNYEQLEVSNITCICDDGLSYLQSSQTTFDWIYVDPSRRHDSKGKVFFLNDCVPNIPEHLVKLWSHSKNIMIKTSPLLDLTVGLSELKFVKKIHVVAVNNEVKELLWILEYGFTGEIEIKTINIKSQLVEHFDFFMNQEPAAEDHFNKPLDFLYEPNAAILKSGGFNILTSVLSVSKLHKHSHLYTSEHLLNFPGRAFEILKVIPYNKKQVKGLKIAKANITTRNFPETVQNIRNNFKIKDGGDQYLFFTTNMNNEKIVIIANKVL
ncbi:class I SAM-dependent methyltransferase [Gelidibacter salicanalis]|uniref:Class I SAM-dependent methyltransferase n=1 Tax=Gelidibacter salicanalis TaxID=291193 RepID=A0A5C7AEU9_9FLAO|nr:class I SAM-dependent methyltransferase [Gelidibacter salicanalis]TXE05993.1 class I SAM-dependent methyltransferase [Gelidibacter salicanalis]